jgi:hypothetical protein
VPLKVFRGTLRYASKGFRDTLRYAPKDIYEHFEICLKIYFGALQDVPLKVFRGTLICVSKNN